MSYGIARIACMKTKQVSHQITAGFKKNNEISFILFVLLHTFLYFEEAPCDLPSKIMLQAI